ncbi:MAG: TRAP transporter small permease [Proteobacteria bacterium]|nr:TRAP transporter small permease [Pseudomonadota bacterium]MBU1452016.1 TRAP transporter small permease [Pseudomonadota bacterium]MBU2470507.1 TRAP transporter small permease [Pseudomonadota bacterium]MBU2516008.1 TRAP transporter small permease [Pseudomonadota bacterium]
MKTLIQKVTRGLAYVGMFLLIPMMLLTTAEVVGRGVWSRPIPGTLELSSYMLSIFLLLGLSYTHQVKGHVRVTMFTDRLPEKVALALNILTTLLSIFIIAILCWQGYEVAMEEVSVSDMLRVPQYPFRLLVSVAALFLCLELMCDVVDTVRKLAGK